jgi:Tfp pilus assembly protein PilZ
MNAAVTGQDPRTTTPVSDLSETGCFVHTDEPLDIGDVIELCFTAFPEEPVLFRGQGRVVRHAAPGEPVGMGVEFVELSDAARDVVRKILLRDEANRQSRLLAKSDETLRTHGLVARLLQARDPDPGSS